MYEIIFFTIQTFIYLLIIIGLVNIVLSFTLSSIYDLKERLRLLRLIEEGVDINSYKPYLSVIVPAWNEEVGIVKTISSLINTNYSNMEILVVDDGSTDGTSQRVMNFIDKLNNKSVKKAKQIKLINQKNGGKGKALNTGIQNAKGDLILTMDADSAITKNGIHNLVRYFSDKNIMGVVGNVVVAHNSSFVGELQKLEYLFGFYLKRAHAVIGAEYIFGGACACYRKEVFEKLGGFDEQNKTEDIEMSMRTRFNGMECTFAEDVIVYTEGASTTGSLINQRVRWKKGRFDTFAKYAPLFFSTEDKHNGWLSFYQLPMYLIGEFLLFLSPIAISLMVTYTLFTSDYITLALNIFFLGFFYLTTAFFARQFKPQLLIMFPLTWTMFYYFVFVEYVAQLKSFYLMLRKKDVVWQRWNRTGINNSLK